ncbi:ribosomal RNA small subunit methyltransferase A [Nocardia goodfellowii]|nr:rRNA adenine N-6-methyltransferase family protein [Nocardia goodfellowii]
MAQDFAYRNYSHTQGKIKNSGGGRLSRDSNGHKLSRNFLVNPEVVARMIAVADPSGSVVEPWAGEGVLTLALARRGARVTDYEQDPLPAAKLAARTRAENRIHVVRSDFGKAKVPREPFAVIGNIPLAATTRIVDWCLAAPTLTSATLLIQQEHKRWSLETAVTWPWFDWQLHGQADRDSFRPAAAVDATILHLRRRAEPMVRERDSYTELVRLGFTGADGPVHAALRARHPGVDQALAVAGVENGAAAGDVHPDQWVRLHDQLVA